MRDRRHHQPHRPPPGHRRAADGQGDADAAADGAIVSALGMFEQGFYDRLGFGTGGYEHLVALDPSQLRFPRPGRSRVPRRITTDDWEAVHANRRNRFRGHGACSRSPS